jgi:hypothetical protein
LFEDDAIIAMDLAATVEGLDGLVVGPFATVAEALAALDGETIAGAVLDANLEDRDITPVAIRLTETAVPFVVHTGTGLPAELSAVFPALPIVLKPAPSDFVLKRLAELLS